MCSDIYSGAGDDLGPGNRDAVRGERRSPVSVLNRCPVCKARLKSSTKAECHRCGCDLGVPQAIVQNARRYYRQSVACAMDGDFDAALAFNGQALYLYRDDDFIVWEAFLKKMLRGESCT